MTKQQDATWYDVIYDSKGGNNYALHYTCSPYYATWCVIIDRLLRYGSLRASILDIGCGVGQFAHLLSDSSFTGYVGIDFSGVAIAQARVRCQSFTFMQEDALTSGYVSDSYDVVTMLEFLEHIEGDIAVLKRIPAGTKVYATVPNFSYTSHVRYFADAASVYSRYSALFTDINVSAIRLNSEGLMLFIFEGVRA